MNCYLLGCQTLDELREQLVVAKARISDLETSIANYHTHKTGGFSYAEAQWIGEVVKLRKVVAAVKKSINGCNQDYGVYWCENECISGDICRALAELDKGGKENDT